MRHHIDFIQAQHLPWISSAPLGFERGEQKLLSSDAEGEGASCILRLDPGATRNAGPLPFDEEFYVLDGAVSFGDRTYGENAYGFLPSGYVRNAVATAQGATILYFRSDTRPDGAETDAARIAARLVPMIDVSEGLWDGDFAKFGLESMRAGARMRILREDPYTQQTTYVTATIAFRRGEMAERHPIVQEFFLLSGELAGEFGIMQAGAYCFRPPMAKHGPYGSPTGALIFFRGLGGKQETFWEPAGPFSFHPSHGPILPKELEAFGAPAPRPPRY